MGPLPSRLAPISTRRSSASLLGELQSRSKAQHTRWNSTPSPSYQPPNSNPSPSGPQDARSSAANPHHNKQSAFYTDFGMPLFKTVLSSLLTYQVLYWGWLKLESIEAKKLKQEEVKSLEAGVVEMLKGAKFGDGA